MTTLRNHTRQYVIKSSDPVEKNLKEGVIPQYGYWSQGGDMHSRNYSVFEVRLTFKSWFFHL